MEFPTADICTLKLKIRVGNSSVTEPSLINIHNVYNPSPVSSTSINRPSTLPAAAHQLVGPGPHILLGDFNLHHPFWNGPSRPTQHAAADHLLDLVDEHRLSLALPRGTITWQARGSMSTLDLVFLSEGLSNRILQCGTALGLAQSSDHLPVSTILQLASIPLPPVRRRAWKLLDMKKLRKMEGSAPAPSHPRNRQEIDECALALQKFLQRIVQAAVPWAKASPHAKSHWTTECSEVVKEVRSLRRR